ncbi:MAG: PEP-CTERM sorting domain-containing protein [Phycisphaerales bacterium]|nr:PEP-CTERM sorting domain-containing protein [Phycisphaerales bacterium]
MKSNAVKFRRKMVLSALLGAAASVASAAPYVSTATVGSLSARAEFDTAGTNLIVTLSNISAADVLIPSDVLTSVFFDIAGGPTLTRVSANLAPGSTVLFGPDGGGNVGGEWAYVNDTGFAFLSKYGIGSAGLDIFGPGDVFPGPNLQGPVEPDGLQYGITSQGDNPATGNAPVTGGFALIKHSVVFVLSGLPQGFDPSQSISNVQFQYGTSLDQPRTPEPSALALLAVGALYAARRRSASKA